MILEVNFNALAGLAKWIEHQTANQRVTSSIPNQGTCLGCGPGPWGGGAGGVHERQPHINVSLPLALLSPLSKKKLIKSFLKYI